MRKEHLNSKVIAFFVTEDWYFCSHRLDLAIAARNSGYSVHVITRVGSHGSQIESAGLNLVPTRLSRRSKNPLAEASAIWHLVRTYRRLRPAVVHHVALKPVLYGSIAARIAKVPAVVNAMAGLGFLYSSQKLAARVLRPLINLFLKAVLNNERTVVVLQNPDDEDLLCSNGLVSRDRVRLIRGSGVDAQTYPYVPEPGGVPIVLLACRLLWDKGVGEFVRAAALLKHEGVQARFVLVGEGDDANPESIDADQLKEWELQGHVEQWGQCSDMPKVFAGAHVVCLPSYREGLPKVLIEAASCGRPIVTTDAPGCREIVQNGVNGILVPIKDADALAAAIRRLVLSPSLRQEMGLLGRQLVESDFSLDRVVSETLAVYAAFEE